MLAVHPHRQALTRVGKQTAKRTFGYLRIWLPLSYSCSAVLVLFVVQQYQLAPSIVTRYYSIFADVSSCLPSQTRLWPHLNLITRYLVLLFLRALWWTRSACVFIPNVDTHLKLPLGKWCQYQSRKDLFSDGVGPSFSCICKVNGVECLVSLLWGNSVFF